MSAHRPILVLKTGEPPASVKAVHGEFDLWMARGLQRPLTHILAVNAHRGEALPDPDAVSGVVVTGSPAMVTDRADWSERAGRWLAEVVRADALPVLGVCYGHQLMAHALGGRVDANPNGREIGTFEVRVNDEDDALGPLVPSIGFPAHFSHLESVLELPPGARAFAATALEPHAVIAFGPRQWGVQFHPEFDETIMRAYLEARREPVREEGGDVDALIADVRETPLSTSMLSRFSAYAYAEAQAESE